MRRNNLLAVLFVAGSMVASGACLVGCGETATENEVMQVDEAKLQAEQEAMRAAQEAAHRGPGQ